MILEIRITSSACRLRRSTRRYWEIRWRDPYQWGRTAKAGAGRL